MTNAEARFNNSLRPRKPEGSLGRRAQDVHLDSHTAPELCWFNKVQNLINRRTVSVTTSGFMVKIVKYSYPKGGQSEREDREREREATDSMTSCSNKKLNKAQNTCKSTQVSVTTSCFMLKVVKYS